MWFRFWNAKTTFEKTKKPEIKKLKPVFKEIKDKMLFLFVFPDNWIF